MLSVQSIYAEPSKYLFFHRSIWTLLLGLEPSSVTLALSFICALLMLVLGIECTSSIEGNGRNRSILYTIRTALAILAGILYLDAIFVKHLVGQRHSSSSIATIGIYGLFRVWEVCIAPLLDGENSPKWLKVTSTDMAIGNGDRGINKNLPEKGIRHRNIRPDHEKSIFGYSLDLISTIRGVSWLGDRHFDFLPKSIILEQKDSLSRSSFIRNRLFHFLLVCLCYDVCDSITKSQRWIRVEDLIHTLPDGSITMTSPSSPFYAHQITTRPLYQQAIFVLVVAITTQLSIETFYTLFAVVCVGALNVSPKAFPHFFNSPISLHTDSLRSFWGTRWHHIFRRIFDRAIEPCLHVMGVPKRSQLRALLKVAVVFALSGCIHCVIQARTLVYHYPSGFAPRLFDPDTLRFFLSQPFALFFEHFLIRPSLRHLPPPVAYLVRRMWTWGWLFWSARWWADTWVKMGMWLPEEQVVFFSPVRGLWKDEWIVEPQ